jgi:ubiquinone/menaquinone biosynthesis C-methylase UbiE
VKLREIPRDVFILSKIFIKAIMPRKHIECLDVKEHYANEHYDWISMPQFPEKILHDKRKNIMQSKVNKYVNNTSILDVGCGTGLITQVLHGDITGLDISTWKLERAKRYIPNAKFVEGDAENLPFKDNSFDCIISTDIIEHLERPDLAIKEIKRVLKQGGLYLGTVPSKHIIWKLRRFLTTSDFGVEPFHNYYSVEQVRAMIKDLEIVEVEHQCYGLEIFFAAMKV